MQERVVRVEGALNARNVRFGVVASRFNDVIVDRLVSAAVDALIEHGADAADIALVRVPGAFEIPLALTRLAASKRHDALIALGCVIRGETPHFDYVAGEAARGAARVMTGHEIPVGFGILTVDTVEQAIDRAGGRAGNKGADAALAAIEMATLLRRLER